MHVVVSESSGPFLRWARQYVRHDRTNRALVVFRPVRASDRRLLPKVQHVYGRAARTAGENGTVIISVGHGGSRADRGGGLGAGMADLAPNGALRIKRENVFYSSQQRSDRQVAQEADRISRARCRQLVSSYDLDESGTAAGRRLPAPPESQVQAFAMCRGAPNARSRLLIRRCYDAVGEKLRRYGVSDVVFLSCNVGNATRFVDQIATDWGVRVIAYTRRVAVIQDSGNLFRIYLEGDRAGVGTNTERSRFELPEASAYTSNTGHTAGR